MTKHAQDPHVYNSSLKHAHANYSVNAIECIAEVCNSFTPNQLPELARWTKPDGPRPAGMVSKIGNCFFAKFCNFLAGSFSAVSKPIFASKHAFCSIFKIYKICALLHRSKLNNLAKIGLTIQQITSN